MASRKPCMSRGGYAGLHGVCPDREATAAPTRRPSQRVRSDFIGANFWWILLLCAALIGGVVFLVVYVEKTGRPDRKYQRSARLCIPLSIRSTPSMRSAGRQRLRPHRRPDPDPVLRPDGVRYSQRRLHVLRRCAGMVQRPVYLPADSRDADPVGYHQLGGMHAARGKGKLRHIFVVSCYALLPKLISTVLMLVFSIRCFRMTVESSMSF